MQSSQIPAKFPIPFASAAGAGYKRTIPKDSQIGILNGAASLTDGFPPVCFQPVGAGGTPPAGQDFNGIFNEITLWDQWDQAGAPIFFDATFAAAIGGYPKGAIVSNLNINGNFWLCTVENNTSNPDTGGAGWTSWSVSRTRLQTPTTLYVNASTGNDANPGTLAAPFLTIQAAINYAQASIDLNAQILTINAVGTYTAGASFSGLFSGQIGPSGVVLNLTSATLNVVGNCIQASSGAELTVVGGTFSCTTSGAAGFAAAVSSLSTIVMSGGHTFGVCGLGHLASFGGQMTIAGNYTVNGNAPIHLYSAPGGQVFATGSNTITLTGTPAFSTAFAYAAFGYIQFANTTFSGAATGARYSVIQYGLVYTAGGGANYFPGNVAGSVTAGTYA